MLDIVIPLRAFSKKNSRRIFRNRWGKGIVNLPSTAFEKFELDCQEFLAEFSGSITGPFLMDLIYEVKGKADADLDNIATAVLDVLQHYRVIENDRQYMGTNYQRKIIGAKSWCIKLHLTPSE